MAELAGGKETGGCGGSWEESGYLFKTDIILVGDHEGREEWFVNR